MERVSEWNADVSGRRCATVLYIRIVFVWDERENLANQRKHGVSFNTASGVFTDPVAASYVGPDRGWGQRWHTIGLAGAIVALLVVHTVEGTDEEEIRIISARKATPRERDLYDSAQ